MSKTKRTSSKKKQSEIGSVKVELANLDTSISIAKGMLATLSLRHPSAWIRKLEKMEPEHLRILLQEAMDEIWHAESAMTSLRQILEKKYQGICLL